MILLIIISIAIFILANLAIISYYQQRLKLFGLLKAITTSLIILLSFTIVTAAPTTYSKIFFASLFFALVGDVLLIGYRHLLPGLLFFFIAHIGLILAITSLYGFKLSPYPLVPLAIFGLSFFFYMKKSLGKFIIPVALYMVVILVMNWQAINLIFIQSSLSSWLIAIASVLFTFSDSVISYNLFKKQFRASELLILSTYWMSIFMLVIAGYYL
jgi:uncharacterized membrane protein YhhN